MDCFETKRMYYVHLERFSVYWILRSKALFNIIKYFILDYIEIFHVQYWQNIWINIIRISIRCMTRCHASKLIPLNWPGTLHKWISMIKISFNNHGHSFTIYVILPFLREISTTEFLKQWFHSNSSSDLSDTVELGWMKDCVVINVLL